MEIAVHMIKSMTNFQPFSALPCRPESAPRFPEDRSTAFKDPLLLMIPCGAKLDFLALW